jgi:hypothetical protein
MTSGVLDKTRLVSNILMLLLLAGNLFFSVQYIENIKQQASQINDTSSTRYLAIHALKDFIGTVLTTNGVVSYSDRVRLENDIVQVKDHNLLTEWTDFVNSKDSATAQQNAVKVMSTLASDATN